MKKLCAFFYCSGAELDGVERLDKHRPSWYNKNKNFKSFYNAAKAVNLDVYVVYDGDENDYMNYIKSHDIKEFLNVHHGTGLETIKDVYKKMTSLADEYEYFYLSEDDYLYLPDAFSVLLEGISEIGDNTIYTLYDHPDRYTRTDDITFGKERLKLTPNSHWRTAESTCSTYCLNGNVLKEHVYYLINLADREAFRYLNSKGVRLWSPIPGRATHLNTLFMTPLVHWEALNNSIEM